MKIKLILFLSIFFYASLGLAQGFSGCFTTDDFPFNTIAKYGWTRGLYMPSQLGGTQTINSLQIRIADPTYNFDCWGNCSTNIKIYLRHTSQTDYSSSDLSYPGTSGFVKVYDGNLVTNKGGLTYTLPLSTSFNYNGADQLEIMIEKHGDSNWENKSSDDPYWNRSEYNPGGKYIGIHNSSNTSFPSSSNGVRREYNTAILTGVKGSFNPCSYPLPVEFLYMDATCSGKYTDINWATLSEKDNDYFRIEYSEDGIYWREIAQIKGAGNSQIKKEYSFKHQSNNNVETAYYQLTQVDFDGTEEVLQIVSSTCGVNENIRVFPNSSDGIFEVFNIEKNDQINISNSFGKLIYSVTANTNFIKLDISSEPIGIYFLHITSGNKNKTIKLIKQ